MPWERPKKWQKDQKKKTKKNKKEDKEMQFAAKWLDLETHTK